MVHIGLSVFEVDRRQHTVSDMFAFRVIEHFDVVEDVLSGLLAGRICSTPDAWICFVTTENAIYPPNGRGTRADRLIKNSLAI